MDNNFTSNTLSLLQWEEIEHELRKRCSTIPGQDLVDRSKPLPENAIRKQLKKISQLKEMLQQNIEPDFSGITDILQLVELTLKDAVLSMENLVQVKDFIRGSQKIHGFLREQKEDFDALAEEYRSMKSLKDISGIILSAITESNDLNDSQFPELRQLKNELAMVRGDIEKRLNALLHSSSMSKVFQEKIFTTRNDRYVVLVKSGMKGQLKGTVHDISSSGATYYMEPQELIPLNSRLVMVDREIKTEIYRILAGLSQSVKHHGGDLLENLKILSYIDYLTAASRFSMDINGNEPEISSGHEIILRGARHPLLHLMNPGAVVPNDIELGKDFNCLIISGANTGGKTVMLKTTGLCVYLAMMGLHIPAGPDSRIGIFKKIAADIGDDQNLDQSLSTFSGQVVVINEMVTSADQSTLILIDEIMVGTDPRQGASLAQAILEMMIDTGSKIIVTTHYSQLKELPSLDSRFQNASVSFDLETLRPTYRLITGLPGVSYANEIARIYGLDEKIINRSRQLLDSSELSMEALIEKIQKHEQEVSEQKDQLDSLKNELNLERREIERKAGQLKRKTDEIKHMKGIEFLETIGRYREKISEKIAGLQSAGIKEAGAVQKELKKIERDVREELGKSTISRISDRYVPIDTDSIKPGDRVFILSLEKEAAVESIDIKNSTATVLLGAAMKSMIKFSDLYKPVKSAGKEKIKESESKKNRARIKTPDQVKTIPVTVQTSYNTIDLRGCRVDEAVMKMEQDLDRMMRDGINTAVVIHGHGTGALKEAVRQNLIHSLYTSDFRPGDSGEGGDGVTIVRLR